MPAAIENTKLEGVLLFKNRAFADDRGWFTEVWNAEALRSAGFDKPFVQDNMSYSKRGVLRGLHFQNPEPQGKLVTCLKGEIFDVAVDLRKSSRTFGQWVGARLNDENHDQLFIPEGFAHGFVVTSEDALVLYKCTAPYRPQHDTSLAWNDPEVGIQWPLKDPVVSAKDAAAYSLKTLPAQKFFA